ncbi:MAG: FAD-dependent oxidoreductase [Phycisphaerales bacterium]
MASDRTVVVGAGIVGLCTAYFLARAGRRVVVVDREPVGEGASGGNAGLLSIGHYPLTRPGVSWRGLRWMFDRSAPLFIRPRPDPTLISWLWDFHRHCNQRWLDRCMKSLCEMGFPTLALFEEIIAKEGISCDYRRDGWLDVVMRAENLPHAEAEAKALVPHGYRYQMLTGDELRARSPCFSDEVAGAVWYTDSAHCHPRDFMLGLARACERHGVELHIGPEVVGIARDRAGDAAGVLCSDGAHLAGSSVVVAAGVWSGTLGPSMGMDIPMQGARGYHLQYEDIPQLPFTGCVLHETFVAVTPMRDQLRLAGTLEIQELGKPWMRNRLAMLSTGAQRYLRGIDQGRVVAEWAGYRPCTSDGMPVIGAVPGTRGLFIGTGHAMMGMTLGPVSARAIADLVLGKRPAIDLELCDPARYAAGALAGASPAMAGAD